MLKEFKEFISKGNVMEMAVGLILAQYFGTIIKSLVDDIIMPPIGQALGGVDFAELKMVLQEEVTKVTDGVTEVVEPEVAISYGNLINQILPFFIVAFCVFLVIRSYNKMKGRRKKQEEEAPADSGPATPSAEGSTCAAGSAPCAGPSR